METTEQNALVARFVIDAQTALHLAETRSVIPVHHHVLAPTLLRSQVLALLYDAVRRGDMDRRGADQRLEYLRGLNIRLLGDRTLQKTAWKIAAQLGWADTYAAEYIALTVLQADAFITADAALAAAVQGVVVAAPVQALLAV